MLINVQELSYFAKTIQGKNNFKYNTSLFISFDIVNNTCDFLFVNQNYNNKNTFFKKTFKVNIELDKDFNVNENDKAEIKKNNKFTINIKSYELLSFLKGKEKLNKNINLIIAQEALKIDIDNVNYSFLFKKSDKYTLDNYSMPNLDECQFISLKKEDIQQIFNTNNKTNYHKGSFLKNLLCFHKIDNNTIEVVNTTGMNLIYKKINNVKNNISNDYDNNLIIHFDTIKMLKNINENVNIYIKDNCFYIQNDNFLIKQFLEDTSFPRYQNAIIDKNKAKKISFNVKDFTDCISKADKNCKISCLIKGNTMYFYSKTENAIVKNKINIDNEKNQIYFEFKNELLLSSLNFCDKNIKTLNFYFIDRDTPMLIEQDINTFCLFMPSVFWPTCKSDCINYKNRKKGMGAFISEEKKKENEIKEENKEIKEENKEIKEENKEIKEENFNVLDMKKIEIQGWADINIGHKIVKGKQVLNRIRCPFKYLLLKDNKLFTKNGRYIADYDFLQKDYQNVKVSNKNKKYTGQKYTLANNTTIIVLSKKNIISVSFKKTIKDIISRVACF